MVAHYNKNIITTAVPLIDGEYWFISLGYCFELTKNIKNSS
jgi:hypothetical protein